MIDVTELNEAIKEIGIKNIGWIAETDEDGGEYKCFVGTDRGDVFGFDEEEGFRADTNLYWDHFQIIPSIFEGKQDIVLVGYGPAYKEEGNSNE